MLLIEIHTHTCVNKGKGAGVFFFPARGQEKRESLKIQAISKEHTFRFFLNNEVQLKVADLQPQAIFSCPVLLCFVFLLFGSSNLF